MIRLPAVAGFFYSLEEKRLREQINSFFNQVERDKAFQEKIKDIKKINGLIVPHAGYNYSGLTAAYGYYLLKNNPPKKIILLGPSHHHYFYGFYSDENKIWQTPLGEAKIIESKDFKKNKDYHLREHSLEVQVPFLQVINPEARILPILVSEITFLDLEDLARLIKEKYSDHLLIISSDLSHYLPEEKAKQVDKETINNILDLKLDSEIEACGANPIKGAMIYCQITKKRISLLKYMTSAETSGEKRAVVGYASLVF